MELQLGLALPNNFTEGFDLNSRGSEPLSHVGSCLASESGIREYNSKKRSFDEAFVPQTLALLVWNKQPNEEDEGHSELDKNSSTISKSDGDEDGIVGWPPIKTPRRKLCHQNCGGFSGGNFDDGGPRPRGSKSTYVKVKMEGVAIARKVDVNLHHSYQSLRDTLDDMFGRGLKNVKAYKLTYQDGEGDWLLAGDVPWSSFIQSVQRLKLLRSSD
ncbi:auxin-responsive protein IAA20-like isoform X1 [Actinidia eriantha]|uniref:auxin-responsive protein IAA20-like isoform X1 n=1 Tax=Actinidia eriantha TaxID=165200 RepID=UPI00258830B6|nr:auxin-responsive protein IAA20-like isoform X1 [Actinidia eriantha]